MNELRKSVEYLLFVKFKHYDVNVNNKLCAKKFEEEMFSILFHSEYINKAINLLELLDIQDGYFPNDRLGCKYLFNNITVFNILYFDITTIKNDPRKIMIKHFVNLFINSDNVFKNKTAVTLNLVNKIEKSCYNYVVDISKQSENPPCMQWSSPLFLEMYSNRCGIIYNLLNPTSNSNRVYKCNLLKSIIENSIDLNDIGKMLEKDLCPQSLQKERNIIALRHEQHVIEKESNLFKCPNCKERRVTYREVQLRSIDEAPDYLCKCINCNHRFKGKC